MDASISTITAEHIALRAEQDALAQLTSGIAPTCPYPEGSEHAQVWGTALTRYLRVHGAPDAEGGA